MMKNYFIKLILFNAFLFLNTAYAQQDAHIALYKYHMQIFNPAYTGTQQGAFVNSSYRSQWSGIAGSPRIQAISLGIPSTEKRLNYGALFYNDRTFIEQLSRFYVNFSYRLPLNPKMDLYLGLSAGGQNFSINLNSLENVEGIGDQFLNDYSRFNPNFGIGAYLKAENFFASLSVPKIFQTKRFNEDSGFTSTGRDLIHVYGSAGGKIPLSPDWYWVNYALVRYVQDAPWSVVTNTGFSFKNNEITMGYQWDSSFAITLMIQDIGFVSVGYSYQFPTAGALSSITGANHELLLKIRLGKTSRSKQLPTEPIVEPTVETEKTASVN